MVRCVAVAYSDFPVVEWTVYLKNSSATPNTRSCKMFALSIRSSSARPRVSFCFTIRREARIPRLTSNRLRRRCRRATRTTFSSIGGRPTDGDLCYFNLEWPGEGIIAGLGWPGQWDAGFSRDKQRGVRISAGQQLTHFKLLPGEEVRTPLVALQFWEGDWIGAQNVWRRWMIAHNLPRPGGQLPPPQLAGGSGRQTIEMQDANEENQKDFCARPQDGTEDRLLVDGCGLVSRLRTVGGTRAPGSPIRSVSRAACAPYRPARTRAA